MVGAETINMVCKCVLYKRLRKIDMLLCEEVNPQDPVIDDEEFVIQCQNSE